MACIKTEGVPTPLLITILIAFCPSNIDSIRGQQYFVDMTAEYLPDIIDSSTGVDFADINDDGFLDLFVSNVDISPVPNLLLINSSGYSFIDDSDERLPFGRNESTSDCDFGDIDNDGDLDAILGNNDVDNQLIINDGSGYYEDGGDRLPTDWWSDCLDADFGDVDGDLSLDIITASFNHGRNLLYINDGSGTFSIAPESRFPSGTENSNQVDFCDIDGDFDLDVCIANNTGAINQLMLNIGSGYYTDETGDRLPQDLEQSNDIEFGDIDRDGDFDLLVVNGFFPGNEKVWINDGFGFYYDETDLRLPSTGGLSGEGDFGDVDNDGDLDLIIANSSAGGVSTRLYINDGKGFFNDETSQRFASEDDEATDADFGDIDNDGDLDIIIATTGPIGDHEQNRLLINISEPDSFPPTIPRTYHHPDTGDTINPYLITTTVWDNISVVIGESKASLFYRAIDDATDNLSEVDYLEVPMLYCGGFLYRERIPVQNSGKRVEYYIRAEDRMGNVSYDPPNAPDSVFSFLVDVSVGIDDDPFTSPSLPKTFSLSQNYPNPFNPSTTIDYSVPEGEVAEVALRIYDLRGRLIRSLVSGERSAGRYSVRWDGRDNEGREVGSGVYIYRIESGSFTSTRKMTILR